MAYGNSVTVAGNLTRDPELKFLQSGVAVCEFSIAFSKKGKDGNESTSFFDVVAWRQLGENVGNSLAKGQAVVVSGELEQSTWTDKDSGGKRSKIRIIADNVAPSLKFATAEITRNEYNGGNTAAAPAPEAAAAPAAPAAAVDADANPFDII